MTTETRKRRNYTEDFKRDAVALVTEQGYKPGGLAEVVVNPLPRSRTRTQLHHLDGYYDLRNHLVDFLVSRAKAH